MPGAKEAVENSPFCITEPEPCKGRWREIFTEKDSGRETDEVAGRTDPVRKLLYLEIGCGKGRFITTMAGEQPDILFLGLEKYASVLCKAIRKQEELQHDNLRFIRTDAEILTEIFDQGEVDRIYLNFSDPWPKPRHEGRRLPSERFLRRFDRILSPEGVLEFKTDNKELFEFALTELPRASFEAVQMTRDLHRDSIMSEGNIMTEYEEKFSTLGHPIYKYVARRKHTG